MGGKKLRFCALYNMGRVFSSVSKLGLISREIGKWGEQLRWDRGGHRAATRSSLSERFAYAVIFNKSKRPVMIAMLAAFRASTLNIACCRK
jgi:hypothetical protein